MASNLGDNAIAEPCGQPFKMSSMRTRGELDSTNAPTVAL
jgi:hypothetical protein